VCYKSGRDSKFVASLWLLSSSKAPKPVCGRGSALDPAGAFYYAPRPHSRLGRRTPLPILLQIIKYEICRDREILITFQRHCCTVLFLYCNHTKLLKSLAFHFRAIRFRLLISETEAPEYNAIMPWSGTFRMLSLPPRLWARLPGVRSPARLCFVASRRRRRCVHEFATSSRRLPTDSIDNLKTAKQTVSVSVSVSV